MQKCVVSCALLDGEGMYTPDYTEPSIVATVQCGEEQYKTERFSVVNPKWASHFTLGMKSNVGASNDLQITVVHSNGVVLGTVALSLESMLGDVAQRLQLPLRGGTLEENGDTGFINVRMLVRRFEPPAMCGNLSKLGGSHGGRENWKVRFFVLEDDALSYYESEKAYKHGAEPKGVIQLNAYYVTPDSSNVALQKSQTKMKKQAGFPFTVHSCPKSITCMAPTEETMRQWVDMLMKPLEAYQEEVARR